MPQDLNPNPRARSSLVIFNYWAYDIQGSLFLEARLG